MRDGEGLVVGYCLHEGSLEPISITNMSNYIRLQIVSYEADMMLDTIRRRPVTGGRGYMCLSVY